MGDAPERAWLDADWASGIMPEATEDKWEDDDVEYIRVDAILSDPRVMALVNASSSALLFMDEDFGSHSDGQPQREGLRAALAALQVKP